MDATLPLELQRPDLQAAVVRALKLTYDENQDRHDPEIGHDAITFGSAVWRSSVFFLTRELKPIAGVTSEEINQSLAILAGRCRLRVHKLGGSELDDPAASFPNNVGPATRMGGTDRQLTLDLGDVENTEYLDWVIGHYGSADDGLRAVRFQAVGSERALNGSISHWGAIETIFDASPDGSVSARQVDTPDDVVVAPEPTIALRVVRDSGETKGHPA